MIDIKVELMIIVLGIQMLIVVAFSAIIEKNTDFYTNIVTVVMILLAVGFQWFGIVTLNDKLAEVNKYVKLACKLETRER